MLKENNRKRGTNPCTTKVQGFTPKVSNYIVSVWNRIAEEKTQALSRFTYRLQIPEVDRKKIEKIISAINEEPSMEAWCLTHRLLHLIPKP